MEGNNGSVFKLFHNINFKIVVSVLIGTLAVDLFVITMAAVSLSSFQIRNVIIYSALVIAIVLVLMLLVSLIYIIKSINKITKYAKVLSSGKLSVNDIDIEGSNDFAVLAGAINDMKSNIIFFIDNTKNNVIVLSDSIENISKSMNVTYSGNTQIANKIEGISNKSQEELSLVEKSAQKTNDVNKSVISISKHIDDTKTISSDTNTISNNGKDILNSYSENMKLISKSIKDTEEFISKLRLSAHEIGEVVDFIVGLSEELKMLSLNASIEASRAGEAGKGFTVVANEIIKLSNNTKDGIDRINKIVTNILGSSTNVELSIKNSIGNFEKGNEIFTSIREVFSEINKRSENLLNNVNNIASETSNINSNTNNNVKLAKNLKEMSEDISKDTEESVSVIQQELTQFQEVNGSMSDLQSLLTKIQKLTTKFELDIKPVDKKSEKPLKIAVVFLNLGDVWDIIRFGVIYGSKILKSKKVDVNIIKVNSFSNENFIKATKDIEKCVEEKYDGIIMPGFFEKEVNNIAEANIPIVSYNVDINLKNYRIAFVGQNSYESGKVAAKTMIDEVGKKGNLLIVTADKPYENMELRKKGFIDVIKNYKGIKVADILKIPFDNDNAYKIIQEYLKKHNDINGIFDAAGGVNGLAQAIDECKMQNSLKTVVYDTTQEILELIGKGIITCTIGQDPFRQGYDPLIYLYNYLVTGEKPNSKETWTKVQIVNRKNLKHFLV